MSGLGWNLECSRIWRVLYRVTPYPFDFVIGSLHVSRGRMRRLGRFLTEKVMKKYTGELLWKMLEDIRSSPGFRRAGPYRLCGDATETNGRSGILIKNMPMRSMTSSERSSERGKGIELNMAGLEIRAALCPSPSGYPEALPGAGRRNHHRRGRRTQAGAHCLGF